MLVSRLRSSEIGRGCFGLAFKLLAYAASASCQWKEEIRCLFGLEMWLSVAAEQAEASFHCLASRSVDGPGIVCVHVGDHEGFPSLFDIGFLSYEAISELAMLSSIAKGAYLGPCHEFADPHHSLQLRGIRITQDTNPVLRA